MLLSTLPRGLVSPGSACLLAAVPEEWIATFPRPNPTTRNLETDITLVDGRQWLRIILASRKRTLRHSVGRAAQGITYPATITGNSVGTSNFMHHQLSMYAKRRWVILYTEAGTNIVYVIGAPGAGALMLHEYNNTQATQSQLTFSYTGTEPLPVYQGTYTLDNSVTVAPSDTATQVEFYTATGSEPDNTDILLPILIYKTILFVSRSGSTDMQPVTAAPVGQNQIQFDRINGLLRVPSDYPIAENETFTILYR